MRVSISTLGCKANQYDSFAMEDLLATNSFEVVSPSVPADACIINTCTVTMRTDIQSRQLIRKLKRENPGAIIIVAGCYAQVSPEEVAGIDGVDYVVGNKEKERIVGYLLSGGSKGGAEVDVREGIASSPFSLRSGGSSGRTRAYLKIQDGCNNSCSYCIIPKARGMARSLPLCDLLKEIDMLVDKGYREIVFTGIHLGSYGEDLSQPMDITGLVKTIDEIGYPCRFRLSSLDPDEITDELIDAIGTSGSFCNHLHLPLQSGDDGIVERMNRGYTPAFFAGRVTRAVDSIPGLTVGVDVIAGFPGEGEREFMNTYTLLDDLPVAYMHIFPYSKRAGTPAASMPDQVDDRVIKERCRRLKCLDGRKRRGFYSCFIGRELSVVIEGKRDRDTGLLKGRARNYIPVFLEGEDSLMNREIPVMVQEVSDWGVIAVPAGTGAMTL